MSFFDRLFNNKKKEQQEHQPLTTKEKFTEHMKVLDQFKRVAYLPQVTETAAEFSDHSKIGGLPYLRSKEDWPECPNCKKHMQLFLQMDLSSIPENRSNGLLQLFYCTSLNPHCEVDEEAYFPFSKAVKSRIIQINGASKNISSKLEDLFVEKRITSWVAVDDYPHSEDYDSLGIDSDLDEDLYDYLHEDGAGTAIQGDKLFGWPYWIQGAEYPIDRKTGSQMELVFQFDSEVNLPYMFGDSGVGHLTQSPDDKQELAFGWACT